MINIANILLTRRCDMNCSYCRISGNIDYENKPSIYPTKEFLYLEERSSFYWIEFIKRLMLHNENAFIVLYGGEPLLRVKDLSKIVKYCNENNVNYTIISNCNNRKLLDQLLDSVGRLKGFSASIDPGFFKDGDLSNCEYRKSNKGFSTLKYLMTLDMVDDPVAEMTISKYNLKDVVDSIEVLSDHDITTSITFLDVAKTNFYDFSDIKDLSLIPEKNEDVWEVLEYLIHSDYKIHMKDILLPKIFSILPSNLDCEIEKDLHNICLDSSGRIRLCLRILGDVDGGDALDLIDSNGRISKLLHQIIINNKKEYCKGCNHTCYLMSKMDQKRVIFH